MKRKCPFFLLMLLAASACEDPSSKALLSQPSNALVVDGIITSERKNHLITLSYPYLSQNGVGKPATGAQIILSVADSTYSLQESPAGSGKYYTPLLSAVTARNYIIRITLDGDQYTANDISPPVEPMNGLQYYRTDSLYSLSLNDSGSQPNYIQYDLDWTASGRCQAGVPCKGEIYYYDLKTADVNDIFKPDKAPLYFPPGTIVIRKKYSVSMAYRAFLRSMLSETEWHGGIYDVQAAPVTTNLNNGAIGFFAVSTVVSDTAVIVGKP